MSERQNGPKEERAFRCNESHRSSLTLRVFTLVMPIGHKITRSVDSDDEPIAVAQRGCRAGTPESGTD